MIDKINQISNIGQISSDKIKWATFGFTNEEDLCLVTTEGVLYLVDPLTGELKEKPQTLSYDFQQYNIVDSKLDDNFLVLRTVNN